MTDVAASPPKGNAALEHVDEAVGVLVEVMRSGGSDAARVKAANSLLDRAWGKPSQAVSISPSFEDMLDALSPEGLTNIARGGA